MNNIDYTGYDMILADGAFSMMGIKINEKTLLLRPQKFADYICEALDGEMITLSISVMKPVLLKLSDEDWDFKFENDADRHELEEIGEYNTPEERLDKVIEYFNLKYNADPISKTRLILSPPDSYSNFVIYYGKTINPQNNSIKDIRYLFTLILNQKGGSKDE